MGLQLGAPEHNPPATTASASKLFATLPGRRQYLRRSGRADTLEANWKGLGDPTHGVFVDGRFYFIANSGWDVKPGATFEPPTIRVLVQ
jgi:hypothetical protein